MPPPCPFGSRPRAVVTGTKGWLRETHNQTTLFAATDRPRVQDSEALGVAARMRLVLDVALAAGSDGRGQGQAGA